MFLHGSLGHVLMNMLGLFFFGGDLEAELGLKRFLRLYFGCGIVAGVGWMLISGGSGATCIGASGAVFGVVGAFAALFPRREVMLIFPPVAMSASTLALVFGAISLVLLVGGSGEVAHAAHLAGGLAGYAYGCWSRGVWPRVLSNLLAKRRRGRLRVLDNDADEPPVNPAEVDAILERIKANGIRSLSRKQRRLLERASRKRKDSR